MLYVIRISVSSTFCLIIDSLFPLSHPSVVDKLPTRPKPLESFTADWSKCRMNTLRSLSDTDSDTREREQRSDDILLKAWDRISAVRAEEQSVEENI
jgi:hypothetical protein